MLFPRLLKRFMIALVVSVLLMTFLAGLLNLPLWSWAVLPLAISAVLTFLYWQTFAGTIVCPTCNGTGKVQVHLGYGYETEDDYCPSCDGEGRVPAYRR